MTLNDEMQLPPFHTTNAGNADNLYYWCNNTS